MKPGFVRLAIFAACASLCAIASSAFAAEAPSRPNVIVVLLDDVGYGDFSCHGNPIVKTPNIDALYGESARLVDFHVAPMCTPTRGELLTGVDCLRNGASVVCTSRMQLRRDLPTAADLFVANGYRAGVFGKWHLGESYPYRPEDRGFQESLHFHMAAIGQLADHWQNDYFDPVCVRNGRWQPCDGYCTDVFFRESIAWMRKQAEERQPFFCYLPTNAAHGPFYVPQKYRDPYAGQSKFVASFFGMIANIDENLGRLDAFLRETGLRDNTILILMTDNGGTVGVPIFNAGMRGQKTEYYEGGHRVPCFLRWPAGKLPAGRDLPGLAEAQDLLPTLADLCGLKDTRGARFDGASLASALRGLSPIASRTLVVQYGVPVKNKACVMWERWRLVGDQELYDLAADPAQASNVLAEHPDIAQRLRAHYDTWWAEVEPITRQRGVIVLGDERANPQTLTASEWQTVYVARSQALREGKQTHDAWRVEIARAGQYEFGLRRWPAEANAAITAGVPAWRSHDTGGPDPGLPAGAARPIAHARLKIGDHDQTKQVASSDHAAIFTVALQPGQYTLEAWFTGNDGEESCAAYFVDARRKE